MAKKVKSIDEARAPSAESGDGTAAIRESVKEKVRTVKEKFAEARQEMGKASAGARQAAERVSAAAQGNYDTTVQTLKQGYDRVRKDFDALTEDVNEYVRDNPGRSVLIAAGVGFVVGLLLRGDRRG